MTRYQCSICGYLYDADLGDPDGGVPEGTEFPMVVEGWTCPICGAAKEQFMPENG